MIRTFTGATALFMGCVALAQSPVIPAPTITKGTAELPAPSKGTSGNSPLEKLKSARADLKTDRDTPVKAADPEEDSTDVDRREMRKRVEDLMKRLESQPKVAAPETKPIPKSSIPAPRETKGGGDNSPEVSPATDALLLAQNLYKSGDFPSALNAFRIIDLDNYPSDDRLFIKYMTASCLRRTGKLSEALSLYRDVASSKGDDFVRECAQWQIGSLRTREEMEKQLAQLRQRREAMTPK